MRLGVSQEITQGVVAERAQRFDPLRKWGVPWRGLTIEAPKLDDGAVHLGIQVPTRPAVGNDRRLPRRSIGGGKPASALGHGLAPPLFLFYI